MWLAHRIIMLKLTTRSYSCLYFQKEMSDKRIFGMFYHQFFHLSCVCHTIFMKTEIAVQYFLRTCDKLACIVGKTTAKTNGNTLETFASSRFWAC
mmetsp:Transcript_37311/g.37633  ORF Transcript_37311/g.37633 Transcript_37311/m.37633 type:complete len:95 (+) Transcript_37311:712-996(+)